MNNLPTRKGIIVLLVMSILLVGCADEAGIRGKQAIDLPPCSAEGSIFAERTLDKWPSLFHLGVDAVINAHLEQAGAVGDAALQCTAQDYRALSPASDNLRTVASFLPLWRKNPEMLNDVSEADMGAVLLEYVRVYECSLDEMQNQLPFKAAEQNTNGDALDLGTYHNRQGEALAMIEEERRLARPALERAFELIGGYERLRPLWLEIECLKRASLDLRNGLGLVAEGSACMSRIWDAHGSLRDLPD